MYDASGADSGREWIEVANTGSENVDIGKYKLFENGTNHSLTLSAGSSSLAPNSAAVIAADAQKFLSDYPGFSGSLFDSAFSLSNTGETLVLKNASSSALDTVSYAAVAEANGTGGSLNEKDGAWVAAMASPAIYPSPLTPVPKAPAKVKATSTKKSSSSGAKNSAKQGSGKSPASASPSQNNFSNAASLSLIPDLPQNVLIGLGLSAVALLGVAGVFFIKQKRVETFSPAEEFSIE